MKKILLFLLLAGGVFAQGIQNPIRVIYVNTAPTVGAPCSNLQAMQRDISNGATSGHLYSCEQGLWVDITGSGGGSGTTPYTQTVTAQTSVTITAATHSEGTLAEAACFDNATPRLAVLCSYTRNTSGDLVFAFNPAFTGLIQVGSGNGSGGGSGVTSVTLAGTSNQIVVSGTCTITSTGTCTFSIPNNPTLPGNTTGTFIGNLTGNASGTAATITGVLALANTPLTTRGDILVVNSTPGLARLAKGTQYQTLQGGASDTLFDAVHLDQSTAITGTLPGGNGGTGNAFFAVSGPATSLKTFTFPNASATVLTSNAAVTIGQGGTGAATQQAAFDALAPTATRAGDIAYWNGTHYVNLAGNNSGTNVLQENSSGVPSWVSAGAGTVTVVSSGTLVSTQCVTGGGSQTLQTPSSACTVDSSGNIVALSVTTGNGSAAGGLQLGQGTAPSAGTNAITIYADSSVTSYIIKIPGTAGTGFILNTDTAGSDAWSYVGSSGSGNVVRVTSATLVTPTLGAALATSINGLIISTTTGTFTLTNGKTVSVLKTLTLDGTDSTTMTFPSTSATIARTDAGQTFTGTQTFSTPIALSSLASTVVNATSPGVGICHFAGSTQTCTSSLIVAADITSATITGTQIASSVALAGNPTTTTQTQNDNSTKLATTAYVDRPTNLVAGTSGTLVAPREYFICTTTCTVTPPVPAAGKEFCAINGDSVATVITLAALGSSAMYEVTARNAYGTAGTGTAVSGGAVGDKLCILGLDATHYLVTSYTGTWTMN